MMNGAHREVGRQLAAMTGVNLRLATPQATKIWEARGLALQALASGDLAEAQRVMGLVSERIMDPEVAFEIAVAAVHHCRSDGWTKERILTSTEAARSPCGRGYYLFCSGQIAVCYFPMKCITDMNGRGYHFDIERALDAPLPCPPSQTDLFS